VVRFPPVGPTNGRAISVAEASTPLFHHHSVNREAIRADCGRTWNSVILLTQASSNELAVASMVRRVGFNWKSARRHVTPCVSAPQNVAFGPAVG
jgi:hypothetical protein